MPLAVDGYLDIGDKPTVTGTFETLAGVPQSPSAATVVLVDPVGTATSFVLGTDAEVVDQGAGVVEFTFPAVIARAGTWTVKFHATGGLFVAGQIGVPVRSSVVAPL